MGCFNPQVNQGETINTKEGGRRIVIVKWNILVKESFGEGPSEEKRGNGEYVYYSGTPRKEETLSRNRVFFRGGGRGAFAPP